MADNGTAASAPTIAWDDIGGVAYQRVKVTFGADGVATDVNTGTGLPVTVQGTVPVSGTFWQATQPVSIAGSVTVTGPLTDAQVRATPLPVSGTVTANAGTGTMAVSAASLPLPSGAATAAKQPALGIAGTASTDVITVQGIASGTPQPVSGTVTVGNASLAVTGTFFQATQPVSVAATVNVISPDMTASGTITVTDAVVAAPAGAGAFTSGASTAGSYVAMACSAGGDSEWTVQITALTSGTLYFEGSADSTNGLDGNWINLNGRRTGVVNTSLGGNATANGLYRGNLAGFKYFRVRSVGALSGTPAVVIRTSVGTGATFLNASIPAGTNLIGAVTLSGSGRTSFACATVIAGVTAVTTEALVTMVPVRAGVASATATSQGVTASKRLRITSITVGFISTAAAVLSMRFALRTDPGGVVTATSPILRIIPLSQQAAALAQAGNEMTVDFPDGIEFTGTEKFGITQIGSAVTGTCWVSVVGYEY